MGLSRFLARFVFKYVLRQSKEGVADSLSLFDAAMGNIRQFRNYKKQPFSSLIPPNKFLIFPLSTRWTNIDYKKSTQAPHLLAMQG